MLVDSRVSKRQTGRQENGKEKGVRNEYPFTELLREEKVRKGSRSHKGQEAYGCLFWELLKSGGGITLAGQEN